MLEFLNSVLQWWHWIIIGIVFFILEITTFTLIFIGFGITSILVGIIDLIFNTNINFELSIWGIFSIVSITIWYRFFKIKTVSNAGQSNSMTDMKGIVIEEINPYDRGRVKFNIPLLGEREWEAISKTDKKISCGSQIDVIQVKGQILLVEKSKLEEEF